MDIQATGLAGTGEGGIPGPPGPPTAPAAAADHPATTAAGTVAAIYQAQALQLIRMAHLMLGDRPAAEDVVQEAFAGLYRRWGSLSDPGNALRYLRSSVLNGCRSVLRRRLARRTTPSAEPPERAATPVLSAEAAVLSGEERRQVMVAVRRLPPRQREALVLRFYLDLPEREIAATMGSRRTGGPSRPGRHWPAWTAPVAAAASIVAVVSGSLAVTSLVPGHRAAGHRTSVSRTPATPAGSVPLAAAPATPDGVPAYAVGLSPGPLSARSTRAVVRATATGAVLATIDVPKPFRTFTFVTGAADDRTFVLEAYIPVPPPRRSAQPSGVHRSERVMKTNVTKFFLLRLHPGSGTARLTALPIPEVLNAPAIALSPDGARLAVATNSTLTVYSLANGSAKRWTGSDRNGSVPGSVGLSWEANGRMLAFGVWRGRMRTTTTTIDVRLLDTAGPGGAFWSSTRLVTFPDWPTSGSVAGRAVITGNGSAIVAMAVPGSGPGHVATQILLNEFSARTGRLVKVVKRWHYRKGQITGWPNVQWVNATGSTLIVTITSPDAKVPGGPGGGLTKQVIGIVSQGAFTPLPGIPVGEDPAW